MIFAYIGFLLVGLGGLTILDYRFKLAFWYNAKRSAFVIASAVGIFLAWDILGIALGIFKHGAGPFNLPFTIAPQFPIEELFFLTLLSYSALILYRGIGVWLSRI